MQNGAIDKEIRHQNKNLICIFLLLHSLCHFSASLSGNRGEIKEIV